MTESQLLDEIKISKQELKSLIEAVEVRISLKLEESNKRFIELEKEHHFLKQKLEEQERKIRKNNIVIFGLKHSEQKIRADFGISELKNNSWS